VPLPFIWAAVAAPRDQAPRAGGCDERRRRVRKRPPCPARITA